MLPEGDPNLLENFGSGAPDTPRDHPELPFKDFPPKRTDVESILIVGSGPIIIGQACEFDYSGTQAYKALREEGYRVILVNSNPATIMTDPEMTDATYVDGYAGSGHQDHRQGTLRRDPPHPRWPDALNTTMSLDESGALEKYGCKMIGANAEVIARAEDRDQFAAVIDGVGLGKAKAGIAHSWEEAVAIKGDIGSAPDSPPSPRTGGGFCTTEEEFETIAKRGLHLPRTTEISIEESLKGWKNTSSR